jgi:hypothetical protein
MITERLTITVFGLFGLAFLGGTMALHHFKRPELRSPAPAIAAPDSSLKELAIEIAQLCPHPSNSRAAMLWNAEYAATIAEQRIEKRVCQENFLSQICAESRYWHQAQSPAGPKGLGQVARATFHMALAGCGTESASDEDAFHPGLNLVAAACYMNMLCNRFSPPVALAAYVMGPAHPGVKNFNLATQEALTYSLRVQDTLVKAKEAKEQQIEGTKK